MLFAWHLPVPPYVHHHDDRLEIGLWLQGDDLPHQVMLRCEPDNEEWLLVMQTQKQGDYTRYQADLTLLAGESVRRYCFKLLWENRQQWFGPQGFSIIPPAQIAQFALEIPTLSPAWVADQVFYQIFPDRFSSSGLEHTVKDGSYFHYAVQRDVIRKAWHEPLTDENASSTFYGGDLDGIVERLPYLKALGITALYLNPIFTAPSNHKYDTEDYYQVDPYLGGNAALIRLREKTHELGIRLILDGVFNHTGDTHPWFDRYQQQTEGAYYDPASPHRTRFTFTADGRVLDWKGNTTLPKLDFSSQSVVDSVYQADDSVLRHWLREPYHIDGWRLDVVHMLGEGGSARGNLHHLEGMYRAVKSENPQAYVFGEHFGDARRWLQAGVEDAAMNYMGFALPVRAFLTNVDVAYQPIQLSAAQCAEWMDSYRAGLSHTQQLAMFNQLDSHDTARFITLLADNPQRMPMALVWLFTWIGVPCLYYGDEIGLDGENDPFCRKTFPWDESRWNSDLLALTQRMATLRHRSTALRRGGCHIVHARDEMLVFIRQYENETVLIALQRNGRGRCILPNSPFIPAGRWRCIEGDGKLACENGYIELMMSAESAGVWRWFRE
ncbi:MAG: maltodextrin glucosidase [Hafnia sp.]|uniref:maltodextrin glucosidase n=1 Tax=Hafnia sp. TaxID=1873498 RepID=UPI002FC8ECAF